jgi:hypothetical protein
LPACGTSALLAPTPTRPPPFWIALLLFFDVVFITLSLWTFDR